ncbi:hypothetical protein [Corallococcus llansteffanensis]|uniref:Uncharacterized protein n=1 Tax=Corallococcus llansteffanensis TaxID=2316731 RepID=A0A3A8QJJ6_9BACT|nr:hypothetical protein [Corallococcus llansteffanensis]RKH67891.1 hypothetical protein D7V93_02130 [Corallococcus llansteffanensis]
MPTQKHVSALKLTTQGPPYPPSEIMDKDGNFIVIGNVIQEDLTMKWTAAVVAVDSPVPEFGKLAPYKVVRQLSSDELATSEEVLHTVSLPLACNNYKLVFAPEQMPHAHSVVRPSLPLHEAYIPDYRPIDGRKITSPITLGQWCKAKGTMTIEVGDTYADFSFVFEGMIPHSLYTVMGLRRHEIRPQDTVRPGPLGIPNVFIADAEGKATYSARMPNPFPPGPQSNRIIDVIVLWISSQMSFGGAIGHHGLGGDVHAQLKSGPAPFEGLETRG